MLWNFTSLFHLAYMISTHPFEDYQANRMETFNDGVIFFLSYVFFAFSDWIEDIEVKNLMANVFLYAIFFNIFVNLSNIVY
jgi:hypothetical protein